MRRAYVLAFIFVLCAIAGRSVFLTQPVNSDTAMFVYMGKLVSEGGRVGVDLVDNKLPTVGLLMSAPYRLIGDSWEGYALLGLAMTIASSLLLARSAGRCLGENTRVPVFVAATIWLNFPPMVYGQLQLETVQTLFVTLAACAAMELLSRRDWRDAVVVGLCTGVAVWAKPTAGAILPAVCGAILFFTEWNWVQRVRSIGAIVLGFLVPTMVCVWLLIITDMSDALPATLAQLRDYSMNSQLGWVDFVKPVFVLGVLLFPVLVWGYVFRKDRLRPHPSPLPGGEGTTRAIRAFIVGWLIMETIGVVSQRRMYAYHFLVMGPPAAMLVGLFARRLRMVSLGFAFGPGAVLCAIWTLQIMQWPDRAAGMTEVIGYLENHANSGEKVWMDDYPRLMVESDLKPGSRVPLTFLFGNSDQAPLHFGGMILDDLGRQKPEWIVLYHDVDRYVDFYRHHMIEIAEFPERGKNFEAAWRRIDGYARANYVVVDRVRNFDILRRTDAATADAR